MASDENAGVQCVRPLCGRANVLSTMYLRGVHATVAPRSQGSRAQAPSPSFTEGTMLFLS